MKTLDHIGPIRTWKAFAKKVRSLNTPLLGELDGFDNPILVAGCQRSGTTMLSRLLTNSEEMTKYQFGPDDELDAALLLSGAHARQSEGRYCFQTTYLNARYVEYCEHQNFKLIWMVRSPYSVVYSLVYNWTRGPLNELFSTCGIEAMDEIQKEKYNKWGRVAFSRLEKACLAYNAKSAQIHKILQQTPKDRVMILEYDQFIQNKSIQVPALFQFVGLNYLPAYADKIHSKSIGKSHSLTKKQRIYIEDNCLHTYEKACELLSIR